MNCVIPNCKNRLTKAQVEYAYRVYNTGICWNCQRARDFQEQASKLDEIQEDTTSMEEKMEAII